MSDLTPRYRVMIDHENDGISFWHSVSKHASFNASKYHDLSVKLSGMVWHTASDDDSVTSSLMLTESEIALLRSMPYWHYGPSYARNPLLIFPIESDDNV